MNYCKGANFLTCLVIIITIIICCKKEETEQIYNSQFYYWSGENGNAFVTVTSKEKTTIEDLKNEIGNFVFIESDVFVPFYNDHNLSITTYRIENNACDLFSLVQGKEKPVIYLIGETHLGKSQKEVAAIITNLIKYHEIGAIFLEQPDDFQFNWEEYKQFEQNSKKTIAVMQSLMLEHADMIIEIPLGKYKTFFNEDDSNTKEGLIEISRKIYEQYGEEGIKEVSDLLNNSSSDINKTYDIYGSSKYISAADYLYIMLNLQGIKIPFYNVESRELRKSFKKNLSTYDNDQSTEPKPDSELDERDDYMVNNINNIMMNNRYREAILICGALHLGNMLYKLPNNGYQVEVSYNSLKSNLKQEMAILKNPTYIKYIITNSIISETNINSKYLNVNLPSIEIQNSFNAFFENHPELCLNPNEIESIKRNFYKSYQEGGYRALPQWNLNVIMPDNRSLHIVKSDENNSINFNIIGPVDIKKLVVFKGNENHNYSDMREIKRLRSIHEANQNTSLTIRIKDKITHYEVTGNDIVPIYIGNDFNDLFNKINDKLHKNQVLYIEAVNFSDDKFKGFETTFLLQQKKKAPKLIASTFKEDDAYSRGKISDYYLLPSKIEESVEPVKCDKIQEGPNKGLYSGVKDFIVSLSDRVVKMSVRIISKNQDLPNNFFNLVSDIIKNATSKISLAFAINTARDEIMNEFNLKKKDIIVELLDHNGSVKIVMVYPYYGNIIVIRRI